MEPRECININDGVASSKSTSATTSSTTSISTTPSINRIYTTPSTEQYSKTPRIAKTPSTPKTPYEPKKVFVLFTPDTWPQQSTITNKNVHSPPKTSIPLSELRIISEQRLRSLTQQDIINIKIATQFKKPMVREWFRREWFEDNLEIPNEQVLRTVYSVFCRLTKLNHLSHSIRDEFRSMWSGMVRYSPSRVPHAKRVLEKKVPNPDSESYKHSVIRDTKRNEYDPELCSAISMMILE
ncbi:hypothetical protein SAMD00019534_095740 [Acytostelium subglobosum LB1]|uniref:hypothetical protein n=1 Tax=Acytostelium subglobosum LB1 TaxID=1410327 RepID=UPI0006447E02|nr:hypothetical protein SAMD00019534_095740 [Acytostelium subglobosum LB1]GAM26399.1 hypothetical protein SAMD00019534_095740 [Acytostelium subglobosum LB1]|eukprot:XP_012750495.1 hypothetical protein SAMD00019534_095740 [Acytostelium subglobosum LB1]